MITKKDFKKLELNKFEHAKKYCQLLESKPEDLMICQETESYKNLIDRSIKIGTLNLKHDGDFFDVIIRNVSGNSFAFYPEKEIIIIGQKSLDRLL